MFKHILFKEISESIKNYRFYILLIFAFIFIPVTLIFSTLNIKMKFDEYSEYKIKYMETLKGEIDYNFSAEGYSLPLIDNIYTDKILDYLPYKVKTMNDGKSEISNNGTINESLTSLFGYLDYSYLFLFVFSLMAFLFAYNLVNQELDNFTMQLLFNNPVPRYKIFLAKLLGNYIVFIVPLFLSSVICLLIIAINFKNIISSSFWITSFFVFMYSALFVFIYFIIGLFFSVVTKQTKKAMIQLLILWFFFTIIVPEGSPILGSFLSPIESEQSFNSEIQKIEEDYSARIINKQNLILIEVCNNNHVPLPIDLESFLKEPKHTNLIKEYELREKSQISEIRTEKSHRCKEVKDRYLKKLNENSLVVKGISRLSPNCCFQYILNEISETGYSYISNFYSLAYSFQVQMDFVLYDKITSTTYVDENGKSFIVGHQEKGFDLKKIDIPTFIYKRVPIEYMLSEISIDTIILILYGFIFFLLGYFKFNTMEISKL